MPRILTMHKVALVASILLVVPLVVSSHGHEGDGSHEATHAHAGMKLEAHPGEEPVNAFRSAEFRRDKEHIQEHMADKNINLDSASPEELDFHFFKMHDLDGDNKLDGLELYGAMAHAYDAQLNQEKSKVEASPEMYAQAVATIMDHVIKSTDKILGDLDNNNDGFINYMEYTKDIRTKEQLINMAKLFPRS